MASVDTAPQRAIASLHMIAAGNAPDLVLAKQGLSAVEFASELVAALGLCHIASETEFRLPLPKVIGPVTEMVQEISALCGDMEGTETTCDVVSAVLNAAKRYMGGERG